MDGKSSELLPYDIYEINKYAEDEISSIKTNVADENVGVVTEQCVVKKAKKTLKKNEVKCLFTGFKLTKESEREYKSGLMDNTLHVFQIVTGYLHSSKVKLQLFGYTSESCTSNHHLDTIFAFVDKSYKPVSTTEFEYNIVYSYKKIVSFGFKKQFPYLFSMFSPINHSWLAETCGEQKYFEIHAYPDDELMFSLRFTHKRKKKIHKHFKIKEVDSHYSTTRLNPNNPAGYSIVTVKEKKTNIEYDHETFKKHSSNGYEVSLKYEWDKGHTVKYSLGKDTKKVFNNHEPCENEIYQKYLNGTDKLAKAEGYFKKAKQRLEEIRNTYNTINNLLNSGFIPKGSTFDWGISVCAGLSVTVGNKEVVNQNHVEFCLNIKFFAEVIGELKVDFANKALAAIPYLGPFLVAVNESLKTANLGGLELSLNFKTGVKLDASYDRNYNYLYSKVSKNAWDIKGNFILLEIELKAKCEVGAHIDVWLFKIEAKTGAEAYGKAGIGCAVDNATLMLYSIGLVVGCHSFITYGANKREISKRKKKKLEEALSEIEEKKKSLESDHKWASKIELIEPCKIWPNFGKKIATKYTKW